MAGKIFQSNIRSQLIGTGVVVAGWVIGSYGPNTLGVKVVKKIIEWRSPYCKNISAEPETEALLNEVISDINAHQDKPVKRDGIEFLQTNMAYPTYLHKGNSSTGAVIALPIGTRCNARDVFFLHYSSPGSDQMAEFCILSREGKKFCLAREIFYVEDNYVMFRLLLGLGLIASGSVMHYIFNLSLDNLKENKIQMATTGYKSNTNVDELIRTLKVRSFRQRVLSFVFVGCFCAYIYKLLVTEHNWKLEKQADEKVANLGLEYQQGGFEFYQKILQGNVFSYYRLGKGCGCDTDGNVVQSKYLIFRKHLPLTARFHYFSTLMQNNDPSKLEKVLSS